ncbi:MAG TPA: dihydrodipicolinate synthase family protein [Candidatus Acidoferrales bacterium]|nr:dihydrodipicolinate synthase family protein [Candidatus Acidoferrales bacterium]
MARLQGIYIPLPTPFTEKGDVDEDGLRQLVHFYLSAGVHGLFALGTFGQGPALSPEERKRVAGVVLKAVGGRIPVVIHVGCADTPTTISLARDAVDKGAPAVAVVPPYYFEHHDDEVFSHYTAVHDAVRHPLFIYNNAVNSGYRMTAQWTAKLCREIADVCGIKMSFIPLEQQIAFVRALPSSCAVFSGSAVHLMPGVLWGLAGAIHPLTVAIPELLVKLWRAIEGNDLERALGLEERVIDFSNDIVSLSRTYGRAVLRESLRMRDLPIRSFPRWPTKELEPADRKKLASALKAALEA